jgi:bacterial/archaeal transporter family-2 protein
VSRLPFIIAAVAIGGIISLQPGLNADVARRLGNPMVAVFFSTAVAFLLAALYILLTRQPIAWSAVAALPWYLWFAGLIGFFFVLGTMWLAPILGAALLFAAVVAGQMIGATIWDQIGIAGYQGQSIDPWRLAGIAFVLVGVWLLQKPA